MNKRVLTVIVYLFLLVGCSGPESFESFVPEESEFAKQRVSELRAGNIFQLKSHFHPQLLKPGTDAKLREVVGYFPSGDLVDIKLIGANTFKSDVKQTANLSFQYQFSNGWSLVNVGLSREKGNLLLTGLHVSRLPKSLKEIHAFSLEDKSWIHYLFLVLAITIPLFVLYSVIMCILTPMERRKWLWILFILFGVFSFSLNWTTGQVSYQVFKVSLLGSGYFANVYGPLILNITMPIGAVIFFFKRRLILRQISIHEDKP